MKAFAFPLERVLALRREQVQVEELKLQRILEERTRLEREVAELRETERRAAASILAQTALDPIELTALSSFRRWTERQCLALAGRRSECDVRIAEQRARLNTVRQSARLVEKLRERRWAEWQAGFQKEIEEQAAESFLSRWNRERSLAAGRAFVEANSRWSTTASGAGLRSDERDRLAANTERSDPARGRNAGASA